VCISVNIFKDQENTIFMKRDSGIEEKNKIEGLGEDQEPKDTREFLLKRLVLAKLLYIHGCKSASNKDVVSRMVAIHLFDTAVGMILDCIIIKHEISLRGKEYTFGAKWNRISNENVNLTLRNELRAVHELRNLVQHHGEIPSSKKVIESEAYVKSFFADICRVQFKTSYDDIRLSQLIDNNQLKDKILKAESALKRKNFKECMILCDDALLSIVKEHIIPNAGYMVGYFGLTKDFYEVVQNNYPEKYKEKDIYELACELSKAIGEVTLAVSSMQFFDEFRMAFLRHRKRFEQMDTLTDEKLEQGANSSLGFVTEIILKWQGEGTLM
jgi:hypothetical protein